MTDRQKRFLKADMIVLLGGGIASGYIEKIIDNCADKNYNNDDISLAIGRVLVERLGILT